MTKPHLTGLQRLCKAFGSMQMGDTLMVWDYVKDVAVTEKEMPYGSKRWKASERAKYKEQEAN